MELSPQIILLGLVLVVISTFLKRWQPPIKEQYIFIVLSIAGMGLGYYMLNGFNGVLWGIVYTGIVFYKDVLVKEAQDVKDSFINIGQDKSENKEEKEEK